MAAGKNILPDRHAGQRDPISGERPSITCVDCGQVFTAYYYRLHRGVSDNELCPSNPDAKPVTYTTQDVIDFLRGVHPLNKKEIG